MSKLRQSAKGRACQIRLPGYCLRNTETTVLAHLNGAGMGLKQDDRHASFACWSCHNIVDNRVQTDIPEIEKRLAHLEGVIRTQQIWIREGLM